MSKILKAFQQQKNLIRSVIAKYRSNVSDIDEISQDVFLTGFALELREPIHQPEHLLLRIAKNLAINESVKKINKTSVSIEDFDDLSAYAYEQRNSPEDTLAGKQQLAIFAQALASLPPDLKRVFVLRKIDGLKFDQIATRLNLSKSAVEKKVAMAMATCYAYYRERGISPTDLGVTMPHKTSVSSSSVTILSHANKKSNQQK